MYRLRLNRCVQAYRLNRIEAGAFRASCDERYLTTVPCRGSFAQGGVTMRDCSTNRAGFDRVLMAVAATFLAVSATSAMAGPSDTPRASAAELAIDAAIPRPEPANVPPPDHRRLQDRFHRVGARSQPGQPRSRTSPPPPQRSPTPHPSRPKSSPRLRRPTTPQSRRLRLQPRRPRPPRRRLSNQPGSR